jgi:hypothetical protein
LWFVISFFAISWQDFIEKVLKGLRSIGELKGLKKKILVCPGERKMETEAKIEIWPFDFFNQVLENGNLWD